MPRRYRLMIAVLLALAATPAAVAAPANSAPDFAAGWFRWFSNGQWDRMYDALHPADKRLATRARFIACYSKAEVPPFEVEDWKTLGVVHVKTLLPGTKVKAWSTVVTLRLRLKNLDSGKTESLGKTVHLFLIGGQWRWAFDSSAATAFKAGRCPGS